MAGSPHMLFRPPGEADSLIIRIADGCPWNQCAFCGMYQGVRYRPYTEAEIAASIAAACREMPMAQRVFLADGDVMALPFDTLRHVLESLQRRLPRLARVGIYANGYSINQKSDDELRALADLKLHTLYLGLESGDLDILVHMHKRETPDDMIAACQRAQTCGLRMSVMVLIGLGGRSGSAHHAAATANALNRMQPRLLSALRVIPVPGTPLFRDVRTDAFDELTEWEAVAELRAIMAGLALEHTVFRANHASNVVPLEGRFPKDRQRLLDMLDTLLASDELDRLTPGPPPLSL